MPVVIKTREYGSVESYKDFSRIGGAGTEKQAEQDIEELWE